MGDGLAEGLRAGRLVETGVFWLNATFREDEARGAVTYVTADKTWYGGEVNGTGKVKLPDGRMTTGSLSYTPWRQPVLTIDD